MRVLYIYFRLYSLDKYVLSTDWVSDTGSFCQLCFVQLNTRAPHEFITAEHPQDLTNSICYMRGNSRWDAKWPLRLSMCLAMDGSLRFGTEAAEVVRTEILLLYKLLSQRSCSVWLWRTQVRTKYQRFAKLKNNCTLCSKFWQHGSLLTSKENQRTSNWKEITLSFLIYPLIPELGCVSGQNSSKILKGNEVAE